MPVDPTETFRQEAAELLAGLEQTLLDLEDNPDDRALVDQAFRALHTLKGSGGMFGFDAVAAFTHNLENAFERVRSGEQPVSRGLFSVTLGALDHIRDLISAPDAADPRRGDALLAALGEVMGATAEAASAQKTGTAGPEAQDDDGESTWRIRFKPNDDILAFGANPVLLLEEVAGLGLCHIAPITGEVPPLEAIDPTRCYLGWDIVLTTSEPRTAVEEVFIFVADQAELTIERIPDAGSEEGARLGEILVARRDASPEDVKEALSQQKKVGELLAEQGRVAPDKVRSALAEQQHLRERSGVAQREATSVRVQAERLDSLMDQVGELVIAQARLRQVAEGSDDLTLKSIAEEIERLSSDLRDTTMSIRMLPIGTLFGRFRRLVRDLSEELGKTVTLSTEGEDTELDKTVIERLNDPLVHLIRNAVDHGIEDELGRRRAGKTLDGRIHLAAVHSGAQVLITVADDGHGLDCDAIRRKAEERGLLSPGADIADSELFQFIFHPGFSTAQKVSGVSGRGVGMDVVRQTIDSLRGNVEVDSTPGTGTRVTLKLPLTLAIIDGLLVRVGEGRYVVPLAAVEECVDLGREHRSQSDGRNFLNIRDDIVPFVRLRDLFRVSQGASDDPKVVIVTSGGIRVGLVVDQVIGQYQTVIKSLSKLLDDVKGFSGATILGDGTVALILDVPHLIGFAQERENELKAS